MSDISLDFKQAKVKHLQFKSNLRSILYGAAGIDEKPVLSQYDCTVGKWIYDYALVKYADIPEMKDLERVHGDIHKKAAELINLFKSNEIDKAKLGLADIENIADNLVALLEIIEHKISKKANSYLTDPKNYQSLEQTLTELEALARANEDLDKLIKRQSLELSFERQHLRDLFMQFPAMITVIKGRDHIIEIANEPARRLIGSNDVIGKPLKEVLPEFKSQGIAELVDSVFTTGKPVFQKELLIKLNSYPSQVADIYVDLCFIPLKNVDGEIESVISFSYDVTSLVESRKIIEEKALQLQHANEDLEVKVAFRNIQLEKENLELKKKIQLLEKNN
ncbi:MAG: hypothetical protein NVSMB45_06120 [Ginsengibacter sp.]